MFIRYVFICRQLCVYIGNHVYMRATMYMRVDTDLAYIVSMCIKLVCICHTCIRRQRGICRSFSNHAYVGYYVHVGHYVCE